ncbi:MAG: hypothetical protein ACOCP4_03660 [Candidatus Woesearchaeota archaeon]
MFVTGYLLEFSKIFDEEPNEFNTYLNGIGNDTIVKFCSHFLSIDLNKPENKDPTSFLNNWFSSENADFKNEIEEKIQQLDFDLRKNLVIINVYNILTLFEYSFNNLSDETELESNQLEINLFKCILALNEDFNKRDETISHSIKHLDKKNTHPAMVLTSSLIYYDLVSYDLREKIISQFIKSIYLFKFLETYSDATQSLLSGLTGSFNTSSWREFLIKYLPLVHGLIQPTRQGSLEISIQQDENSEENISFLENISINNEITIKELDFIKVRTKPFYKNREYSFRTISPLFTCEKIYEGLYFLLNKINKDLKNNNEVHVNEDFRGFYCLNFSEEYLLYKILEKSFPKKYVRYSGNQLREINISGEPDYYIRNGNKLFLFESKDVLISAEIKQSNDFNIIKDSLEKKFYYYKKDSETHYIGIIQLINNIRKILKDEYTFDKYNKDKIRIYPILITHHSIFNAPGINFFINNWYNDELEKLKDENINVENVNPLIIVDIDSFILYHEIFKNRTLIFEHLLDEYIERIGLKNNKLQPKTVKQLYSAAVESFSTFLDSKIPEKNKKGAPKLFRDLGLNIFE